MTIDEVDTLEDLGFYISEYMRNNCNIYDKSSIQQASRYLDILVKQFNLSDEEKNYVFSRIFSCESQSNEATLKLAQMANKIKVKGRK